VYFLIILFSPEAIVYSPNENFYRTPCSQDKPLPLPSLDDEPTLDLSVVIPAYNEEARLPPMLISTLGHLTSPNTPSRSFEIIIVDDGSSDNTEEVALSQTHAQYNSTSSGSGCEIRLVRLCKNKGKGAAVKHGFLHARGHHILMVDADGASNFSDLEELWKEMDAIKRDGHAISVGSRAHLVGTNAVVKRSFVRNLLMHGFHFTLRTLGVGHIRDTQCGFKLFTRASARALFPTMHIAHWIFDVELLLVARMLAIPVVEVPVGWHEVAGSKINLVTDSIGMLKDLLILRANYAIGRWSANSRVKSKID